MFEMKIIKHKKCIGLKMGFTINKVYQIVVITMRFFKDYLYFYKKENFLFEKVG